MERSKNWRTRNLMARSFAMRLPRLTTRRLMVIVAVVGVTLAFINLDRRRRFCEGLALYHDLEEGMARASLRYDLKIKRSQSVANGDGTGGSSAPANIHAW